ncbi:MAG: gluconate 2-dehydrogenase subunit 3 family protein [Gemmatimonadetes bacterium]|nr:gluconate 2-dehydrogenase subunit 3 family protein [Gemmatimonadota bacterium]
MSTLSSRRDFVARSGTMVGGAWLAVHLPAIEAAARHARRALGRHAPFGVIYFMDKALGTFGAQFLQPIRGGLPDLLKAARAKNPAVRGFAELSFEQQTDVLRGMEQTPFFGAVRFLTVAGMFGDPSYGGNQDRIGWQLIGFDGGHAHQPPFGYYDANQR